MSRNKPLDQLKTTGEFDDRLEQGGADFVRKCGSHVIRRKERFTFVYPDHGRNGELSIGVRRQLVKLMLAAGIPAILLGLGYLAWPYLYHLAGA